MKVTVHRGSKEIGGTCIEIKSRKTRILVDSGLPLTTESGERFNLRKEAKTTIADLKSRKILPDISGLYKGDIAAFDAVIISHAHMDHYGLLHFIHQDIPVYLNRSTEELIRLTDLFVLKANIEFKPKILKAWKPETIGDFTVTPHLVDHSAFGALAFEIDDGEKRVFYSGDFRSTGRKGKLLDTFCIHPPKKVDWLMLEGTMMSGTKNDMEKEEDVEHELCRIIEQTKGIKLLFASTQNIDRLVSAYKACRKTNNSFVFDDYAAYVFDVLNQVLKEETGNPKDHLPQSDWKNVRVKHEARQVELLKAKFGIEKVYQYNKKGIKSEEMKTQKEKIMLLARFNPFYKALYKKIGPLKGGVVIWSMWKGYFTEEIKAFCKDNGMDLVFIHTSGHAVLDDLRRMTNALKYEKLIPVHTEFPGRYKEHFERVKEIKNGIEYEVE